MSTVRATALVSSGSWIAFFCLATLPVRANEVRTAGIGIEATPAVLDEVGICMEGRLQGSLETSGLNWKIRIPMASRFGRAVSFYTSTYQGDGRPLTTSVLLSEFKGNWAPPVYMNLWSLSEPDSRMVIHVGYVSEGTEELTEIWFTNFQLQSLLSIGNKDDDQDKLYRVGCRKWDMENRAADSPR